MDGQEFPTLEATAAGFLRQMEGRLAEEPGLQNAVKTAYGREAINSTDDSRFGEACTVMFLGARKLMRGAVDIPVRYGKETVSSREVFGSLHDGDIGRAIALMRKAGVAIILDSNEQRSDIVVADDGFHIGNECGPTHRVAQQAQLLAEAYATWLGNQGHLKKIGVPKRQTKRFLRTPQYIVARTIYNQAAETAAALVFADVPDSSGEPLSSYCTAKVSRSVS